MACALPCLFPPQLLSFLSDEEGLRAWLWFSPGTLLWECSWLFFKFYLI